ncbi:unnamed protein product [Phytomonas sp. Hart1]|nr:unnamed protein product [Phytomonas sp. Hart1]|eukprot:CCW69510.1 unnamed protein product [Phytomonas sp. isolate Hart1]
MLRRVASSFWFLFRQQRLPAIQPLSHPFHIITWLLIVSMLFIPLSMIILFTGKLANELTFRYDDIHQCTAESNQRSFTYIGNRLKLKTGCITTVNFHLNKTLKAPVYLYYGLTGFYQNHRKLANSKSQKQLEGTPVLRKDLENLSPLMRPGELTRTENTPIEVNKKVYNYRDFIYSPGGLLPWSMFNDTFVLYQIPRKDAVLADKKDRFTKDPVRLLICNDSAFSKSTNEPLEGMVNRNPTMGESDNVQALGRNRCRKKGIMWKENISNREKPIFSPPYGGNIEDPLIWGAPRGLDYAEGSSFVESPLSSRMLSNDTYFNEGWYAGELGHAIPISADEDLMVWMHLALSPKFRKLRRIIEEDLTPGDYQMEIGEHYDSVSFGGEKSFTLATVSYLGGKNIFLAKLCLTVGLASLAMVFVFFLLRRQYEIKVQRELECLYEINCIDN